MSSRRPNTALRQSATCLQLPWDTACLPADDSVVNLHALPIYMSIHEFRTHDPTWIPQCLQAAPHVRPAPQTRDGLRGSSAVRGRMFPRGRGHVQGAKRFTQVPEQEWSRQKLMIRHLLDQITDPALELSKQDIHGNTALHYLSSYRDVDDAFLAEMRALSVGGDAQSAQKAARISHETQPQGLSDADRWPTVRNRWVFTAEDLYRNGRKATSEWDKEFLPFWREK